MRRSDEEFKQEILRRFAVYRRERRKRYRQIASVCAAAVVFLAVLLTRTIGEITPETTPWPEGNPESIQKENVAETLGGEEAAEVENYPQTESGILSEREPNADKPIRAVTVAYTGHPEQRYQSEAAAELADYLAMVTAEAADKENTEETLAQAEYRPETYSQPETGSQPESGFQPETGGQPETGSQPESGFQPEKDDQPETGFQPETGTQPETDSQPGREMEEFVQYGERSQACVIRVDDGSGTDRVYTWTGEWLIDETRGTEIPLDQGQREQLNRLLTKLSDK